MPESCPIAPDEKESRRRPNPRDPRREGESSLEAKARELRITEVINAATLGALVGAAGGMFVGTLAGVQWGWTEGGLGGAFWGTHAGALLFAVAVWMRQQRDQRRRE